MTRPGRSCPSPTCGRLGATRDDMRVFQMHRAVRAALDQHRVWRHVPLDERRRLLPPADETALVTEMRRAAVTDPGGLTDAYRHRAADPDDL